jgi:hypothetical protein
MDITTVSLLLSHRITIRQIKWRRPCESMLQNGYSVS